MGVVARRTGDDKDAIRASVDEVEGRPHGEPGSSDGGIEGALRDAAIVAVQPLLATARGLSDPLDVLRVVNPGKNTEGVFHRRQRAFPVDDPSALGSRRERIENHGHALGGFGMAEPGVVPEAQRMGADTYDGSGWIGHLTMIAKPNTEFGVRNSEFGISHLRLCVVCDVRWSQHHCAI